MNFKGEMVGENSPYCIVFCKVLKRDTTKFEEALGKIKDKMLLLGYTDYLKTCDEIAKMIDEGMKEEGKTHSEDFRKEPEWYGKRDITLGG